MQKQRVLSQAAQMEKEQFQRILQVCATLALKLLFAVLIEETYQVRK